MAELTPSDKQLAIYNVWTSTQNCILINSVAGSGKSTTLLKLLEYSDDRTLFLAFNKSIQVELEKKIEQKNLLHGKALTMHSLGLTALKEKYSRVFIKSSKNYGLIKKLRTKEKSTFKGIAWEENSKIGFTMMDLNDASRSFMEDDFHTLLGILNTMDKNPYIYSTVEGDFTTMMYLWQSFLEIRAESYEGNSIEIDFNDMIYLPVLQQLDIPVKPAYLFIDECQDLNIAQHELVNLLLKQGVKKWVAVGDRNQAIYGFSGSSSKSFDLFLEKNDHTVELPLDICYRCSGEVIKYANKVYDVMQQGNPSEGKVETLRDHHAIPQKTLVICRNTKPLIALFFQLLSAERKVYIKGEDILSSLLRQLNPYRKMTTTLAKRELSEDLEELQVNATNSKKESDIIKHYMAKEKYKTFLLIYDNLCTGYEKVSELLDKIKELFVEDEEAIVLCTIHKSKGLEADKVCILNENLIPSKFVKSTEQLKQEENLKYVARTRAISEMYFLNL